MRDSFVLADHKKMRRAPHLVLSDRVQHRYPALICGIAQDLFTVANPAPKPGPGPPAAQAPAHRPRSATAASPATP